MADFARLLKENGNYRKLWIGQIISEIGDHFNTIAVMSLTMEKLGSGGVVAGIFIARALAVMACGPIAGIVLDRLDRRWVMIASDLVRAVIALAFIVTIDQPKPQWLYWLSAALMAASPFFSSGRSAILPSIAEAKDLHTANATTQTTQWICTAAGAFLGGKITGAYGYESAFYFNALSFLVSAACIFLISAPKSAFVAQRSDKKFQPIKEIGDGLRYMWRYPLLFGIAMISVGWATGGGAAQVLFSLLGTKVFGKGSQGIGDLWGAAGLGLVVGGLVGHQLGKKLNFQQYKRSISICYLIHGSFYVLMALTPQLWLALICIAISRAGTAVSSVLNSGQMLKHVEHAYRGRVFAALETITWTVMLLSMAICGWASDKFDPRSIGVVAGLLSSTTALGWWFLNSSGRLPDPDVQRRQEQQIVLGSNG
jgi:predicted MFS family arabinose efflux permease